MNAIVDQFEDLQPRSREEIPSGDQSEICVSDDKNEYDDDPVDEAEGAVAIHFEEAATTRDAAELGVFAEVNGMIDDDIAEEYNDNEGKAFRADTTILPPLCASPALNHIDSCSSTSSQPCSGVRRKSYTVTSPLTAARFPTTASSYHSPSEGYSPSGSNGGAKRKIRPNSDSQDYFAIWTAHSPSPSATELCDVSAFLSVSTSKHRPLERSWPPRAVGQQPTNYRPAEQPFNFELIDTDEPNAFGDAEDEHIDFIPGEFFAERRHAGDGQVHAFARNSGLDENAPLATPETDGSLSADGLPLRTGATPKHQHQQFPELLASCSKLKPLLKKKIGPDNYINTIMTTNMVPTNYNFPYDDSMGGLSFHQNHRDGSPEGSMLPTDSNRCTLKGEFIPLKPHKPLTRQLSGGASPKYTFDRPADGAEGSISLAEQNRHFVLCRKPSPLSPRPRSPPSGSSTRSASPLDLQQPHSRDSQCLSSSPEGAASPVAAVSSSFLSKPVVRPQPRLLTRVGGAQLGGFICPPTPTHHARRLRSLSEGLGPPELRSREIFSPDNPTSPEIRCADIVPLTQHNDYLLRTSEIRENGEGVANGHLTSSRLPSIPERARRVLPDQEDPLPPAWEARMDSHGRIFYIDHTTRTTSWQRPGAAAVGILGIGQHRQQLDRRYQSIRRTITCERRPDRSAEMCDLLPRYMDMELSPPTMAPPPPSLPISQTLPVATTNTDDTHPAILMLCRPDFYSMLHTNTDALTIYNRNAALKHMILRIRRDPLCFERYQYNKDLVALVNCFADSTLSLPPAWDTKLDASGKQFFIDHSNRKTSFMDPRLPSECPRALRQAMEQHRAAAMRTISNDVMTSPFDIGSPVQNDRPPPLPPPRPPMMSRSQVPALTSPEIPIAYNDKVVAFLRQPNILEILKERHGQLLVSRTLRDKINAIRVEGTCALDRLGHDLQLTILLRKNASLFDKGPAGMQLLHIYRR